MLPFGDHLLSADECGNVVVWSKEDAEVRYLHDPIECLLE